MATESLKFRTLEPSDKRRLQLPEAYWTAKLSRVPEHAQATLRKYIINLPQMLERPAGMILSGPAGVGKSSAAGIVLQATRAALVPVRYTGLFTTVSHLRDAIKRTLPFDEYDLFLDRAKSVDMLVLDDLRPEDAQDHYVLPPRLLEAIVMERASRKRPTLLTTRMSPDQLASEFPSLTYSAKALLWPVLLHGASQRSDDPAVAAILGTSALPSGSGMTSTRPTSAGSTVKGKPFR